jgi:hypothetical protein
VSLCPQLLRLSADHARWLPELAGRRGAVEAEGVDRLLALWDAEILPHCRAEEEVLLPELARRLSEADAVVVFTMGDHLVLRRLARDLRPSTGAARAALAAAFAARLAEHLAFEERTLLPALQQTLGCDRLAELGDELIEAGHRSLRPADGPSITHEASRKRGTKP